MSPTMILTHAGVFIVGLALGFLASEGGWWMARHHIKELRMVHRVNLSRDTLLILLASLALLLAGYSAFQGQAQDAARVSCFNAYANAKADADEARQAAVAVKDAAVSDVFATTQLLLKGKVGQRALDAALGRYNAAQTRLERERRLNPYPDAPREVCKP